jgi:hypothetical protein
MSMEGFRMVMISGAHWDGTATERQDYGKAKGTKIQAAKGNSNNTANSKAQKQYATRAELRALKSLDFSNKSHKQQGLDP